MTQIPHSSSTAAIRPIYSCYDRSRRAAIDEGEKSLLTTAARLLQRRNR